MKSVAAACVAILGMLGANAGEVIRLTGKIEMASSAEFFSPYLLRDQTTGQVTAALRDPRRLLNASSIGVQIEGERAAVTEANGVPVFDVVEAAPQNWARPIIWTEENFGPAEYAQRRLGIAAKDFAGRPYAAARGYELDNGLPAHSEFQAGGASSGRGLNFSGLALNLSAGTFRASLPGVAGLRYEVFGLTSIGEAPVSLSSFVATRDGPISFDVPLLRNTGFYFLQISQP